MMVNMTDELLEIADRVRGVATEKRYSQQKVATVLGMARGSVSERFTGKVPFGAHELFRLSEEFKVPVTRFFPQPQRHEAPA